MSESESRQRQNAINSVSPSFCLAKWLQVTIHLQTGHTHSCHHPPSHKIPLKEIMLDPSALHNTRHKMRQRKKMLDGERPSECGYCWAIEDAGPENLSDRMYKSTDTWAYPSLEKVKALPWDTPVNPTYLEVSFGNECNFKCAYCAPHISSAIMAEFREHGPYSVSPGMGLEDLERAGLMPHGKDEPNPYVTAFWEWWPSLEPDLKVFRITGGEPLLNPNTFKFLERLRSHPLPGLTVAINSNLGVPPSTFNRFLEEVRYVTKNRLVKEFQLFTSVDTHGKNAEFVRAGMDYERLMRNVRTYLDEVPQADLIFMCAYNAFSVVNFDKFLEEVTTLKQRYRNASGASRVILSTPYLRDPSYLACSVLTPDFLPHLRRDLRYMTENATSQDGKTLLYQRFEIQMFERILSWLEQLPEDAARDTARRDLYRFIREYCSRKGIDFQEHCPEYAEFMDHCRRLAPAKAP